MVALEVLDRVEVFNCTVEILPLMLEEIACCSPVVALLLMAVWSYQMETFIWFNANMTPPLLNQEWVFLTQPQ
jgi:hypothetical protein